MTGNARRIIAQDLAMDLGTANTLLATAHGTVLLNEPSLVAVDQAKGRVVAVGSAARDLLRDPERGLKAVRPLRHGVIADFDVTRAMISRFIDSVMGKRLFKRPRMVIAVPVGVTQVEMRAVLDAALGARVGQVLLMAEPMAAALGAGLPVSQPMGRMVLDIGGGTTEAAVITMWAMASARSVRVAGDEMNEAVAAMLLAQHGLAVDEETAERLKIAAGWAVEPKEPVNSQVTGRDAATGESRTVTVTDAELRLALDEPLEAIVGTVMDTLRRTSPELVRDVAESGIHLAGGGALLRGLPVLLEQQTNLKALTVDKPLEAVVRGASEALRERKVMRKLFLN